MICELVAVILSQYLNHSLLLLNIKGKYSFSVDLCSGGFLGC